MKKTVKILCAFLTVTMLLPSQVLAADIVSGSQTQLQMHREQAMKARLEYGQVLLILSAGTLVAVLILQRRKHIR